MRYKQERIGQCCVFFRPVTYRRMSELRSKPLLLGQLGLSPIAANEGCR
ncbi:hypothetical protein Enr8_25640 [Blastopirellula retiformator]|uniref:Uncharacterized protein n=1 Tax=Blastopirellula retiformator TaxID=2527970 RepID=A0A5C5V2N5_9BACT|nr:hypothetical protein Enr8_25640 [Blastopirellula retiformator]